MNKRIEIDEEKTWNKNLSAGGDLLLTHVDPGGTLTWEAKLDAGKNKKRIGIDFGKSERNLDL